jgi:hypothetical protein
MNGEPEMSGGRGLHHNLRAELDSIVVAIEKLVSTSFDDRIDACLEDLLEAAYTALDALGD